MESQIEDVEIGGRDGDISKGLEVKGLGVDTEVIELEIGCSLPIRANRKQTAYSNVASKKQIRAICIRR